MSYDCQIIKYTLWLLSEYTSYFASWFCFFQMYTCIYVITILVIFSVCMELVIFSVCMALFLVNTPHHFPHLDCYNFSSWSIVPLWTFLYRVPFKFFFLYYSLGPHSPKWSYQIQKYRQNNRLSYLLVGRLLFRKIKFVERSAL